MVDFMKVHEKINELEKTQQYTSEQLEVIKYALFYEGIDANLLMDPTVSAEMMKIYINLSIRKVPIGRYINEKWHNKGFSTQQLFSIIWADNLGIDVSQITPDVSVEQINAYMQQVLDERQLQQMFNESENVSPEVLSQIEGLNVPYDVKRFLVRVAQNNDISSLLAVGLENYSYEQIKYLHTIINTGGDVSLICNPALSVDEMKQIMLNSPESIAFIEYIKAINENRKDGRK